MSATEEVRLEGAKPGERTISRAVAEFSAGEGRTIDVRIVPYGVAADVADRGGPMYREMWMPGAFTDQVRGAEAGRARQVFVNFEHGNRLSDVIGHGLTLRESGDGFYGSFELHDTADGEKARYMVEQGVLDGVSLEAFPKKSVRSKEGVVQRVKAHLVNIALCRRPAFGGAGVLALREEELMAEIAEELAMPMIADNVRERCRRIGIALPDETPEVVEKSFTREEWDASPSRWGTTEAYIRSCVIDLNPLGRPKLKQMSYLPVREPETDAINLNAVDYALARLEAGFPKTATQRQRDAATSTLKKMLDQADSGSTATRKVQIELVDQHDVEEWSGGGLTVEETTDRAAATADEQAAMTHIDSMLQEAQNYMQAEPDTADKATMAKVMGLLRDLHQKDAQEA